MCRRRSFLSLACALALLPLPAAAVNAAEPALVLTAEVTYPAVFELDGRVTGHAAEKVHEIMRRAAIAYTMRLLPWKRAYTMAESQPATCVFMTSRTEERERQFAWIGPISQTDWVLYGRAGRKFHITELDDVGTLRIGAYNGDVRGDYLAMRGMNMEFAQHDSSNPKKMMLDRIDLWVNSTRSSRPLLAQLALTGKIVPVLTFQHVKLYLACNRQVPAAMTAKMHHAVRMMDADGAYKSIERRFEHLQHH
jgi:polar amino acid transport system substrate-binding protein